MRVSAVVTCHNEAAWVADALASLFAQTRPVSEIVVVDDGSTDQSAGILAAAAAGRENVKVVRISQRGMAAARNAGLIALAPCDYVIHLDGDDWLADNFAAAAAAHAEREGCDAVVTGIVRHRGTAAARGPAPAAPVALQALAARNTLHSCALFRRSMLAELGGFRTDLGGDCDWGLWLEAVAAGYRIGSCDETVYHYRQQRPGSLTETETPADRARHQQILARILDTVPA